MEQGRQNAVAQTENMEKNVCGRASLPSSLGDAFFFSRQVLCQNGGPIPFVDFPGSSAVNNLPANAGDTSSIPGPGGSPGEGNGNLLQFSCLGNSMDGGVRWATVHGVTKSQIQLSN